MLLTNNGHGIGGVRDLLGDDDEEEGEGDEDGYPEGDLLAALRWQEEDHK